MILLCSGQISLRHLDALLLFATGLREAGYSVAIDDRFAPAGMSRHQKFEAVPFLAAPDDITPGCIVIIAAEDISEEVQTLLRAAPPPPGTPVRAVGYFETPQARINSRNRIAYATGTEPEVINRGTPHSKQLIEAPVVPLVTAIARAPVQSEGARTSLLVYMPEDMLEEEGVLHDLATLRHAPRTDLHILTTAKGKAIIRQSRHAGLSVFGYGELAPANLLTYADVFAFFGPGIPGERMAFLALIAMGSGKVVIDCTTSAAFKTAGAPALSGPEHAAALAGYLADTVAGSRREIGRRILLDPWLRACDIATLTESLSLRPSPAASPDERAPATVFFPTNGVGLGHAQRCALIADGLPGESAVRFAAFPSCTDLLRRRGYDCMPVIARSDAHEDAFAADLINYLRLRDMLAPGDTLVFDGGFVFDSVYRVVSELKIPAWWIRRGLWQPEHINPNVLERERAFTGVITPDEAFPELNDVYSSGNHIHRVGPVVRTDASSPKERAGLRKRLGKAFNRPVDTLAVSMLGSGMASERTAQVQMLCSLMEERENCLHLVVVWPHAVVASDFGQWHNSFAVRTDQTLSLCAAADLVVSAAGYNSFHELLYAGIPSIMIPNHATYLDDQEKRARAAADRNLARFVAATDLLTLQREVDGLLDGTVRAEIAAAFTEVPLPERGNNAAAELIRGVNSR
ncbi:glycosyltransferase [Roseobacter sp.]|uniref:glycosyltransferase n=1 Tax=Roseobacter sp. TaxID=1907202 RepID=UPI0025E005C2|nr:glycosyltransferase [Roseobacter sp.]